jgi:fructose-1,6-bisphosphatase/inositol monophosphatase family enzyme
MLGAGDSQRVAELIRETAATELLPRFRNLSKEDVRLKGPGDFVTVADLAAEQHLASGLAKILPGVPVVGEEAVENDASLVDLIGRPNGACWIVDPLDGTANFAAGKNTFAIIVALVRNGQTIGGWILDVPGNRLTVAIEGQGVTLDGKRVHGAFVEKPSGYVGYKVRKTFDRQLPDAQRGQLGKISSLGCAGIEYIDILAGRASFSLYRRAKAWDHAAGALMLKEAGGDARRLDGAPYSPAQDIHAGIIGSSSTIVLTEIRSMFEALQMPLLSKPA